MADESAAGGISSERDSSALAPEIAADSGGVKESGACESGYHPLAHPLADDAWSARDMVGATDDLFAGLPPGDELPPWDGDPDTIPMWRRPPFGRNLPDLPAIPRHLWRDALLPFDDAHRADAVVRSEFTAEDRAAAKAVVDSLARNDRDIYRATPRVAPHPSADKPPPLRQLNFRLTHEDYADLEAASKLLGGKPSSIARLLVLNGVRRFLAEHEAEMDRARRGAR